VFKTLSAVPSVEIFCVFHAAFLDIYPTRDVVIVRFSIWFTIIARNSTVFEPQNRAENLSLSRRTSSKDGFLQKYQNFSQVGTERKKSKEFTLFAGSTNCR
jgi:hypothetical protein